MERKEENETVNAQRFVGLFLRMPLTCSVKEKIWRVVVVFLEDSFGEA